MPDDQDRYLAQPSGPARAGVVVVHDWYGRLPHVRAACDELAAAGLAAVAPDLYGGRTASNPEQAEALAEGMDRAAARDRVEQAAEALRGLVDGGRVGVLAWSLGGMYALQLATTGVADAAAIYYAALEEDDAAQIHCPVLFHLAETDEFDPPEFYERFITALRAAGTEVEVHTWPGTEHSFANGDVPLHTSEQAAEAWAVTVGFLRHHLLGSRAG